MRQITARTISEITTKPVDTTAITEINEELSKGLQYWRISSITLSYNDKGLPNRLTKDEAEAIIEFAKSTPTTEELEANMARLKAKYEAIYGEKVEDFGKDGADTTPRSENQTFTVFGSQTPRTASTEPLERTWEFEIEATDIESAKRKVIREASKRGLIDDYDKESIKAGWQRYKGMHFRAFQYSVAGIYIQ